MIELYKNTVQIGSIGTLNSDLTIGTGDVGFRFRDGSNDILPFDVGSNSATDGLVSFGANSNRFKDLHLSGTAYVGGNMGIGNSVSQAHSNEGTYTTKLRVGDDTASSNQMSTIQIVGRDSTGEGPLGALEFINVRDNDVAAKIVARRDLGSSSHLSAGQLDFYTDDGSGNLNVNMSIDAYGNVGIGTSNPTELLHVNGAAFVEYLKLSTSSTVSASAAGDGALKYTTTLLVSNGVNWIPVFLERDGSSTKPIWFLDDVAGVFSSDTTLYVNPHNKGDDVSYTVDFSNPALPMYQTSLNYTLNPDLSGTVGGACVGHDGALGVCVQGTTNAYDIFSAASACMKAGMRLCTRAEIKDDASRGSGCSHDSRAIWTSDTDGNGNYWRVQGNINSTGAGIEQFSSGDNTTPTGFDTNEIGLRCCTPQTGVSLWEI
jgi:hypothetical protein